MTALPVPHAGAMRLFYHHVSASRFLPRQPNFCCFCSLLSLPLTLHFLCAVSFFAFLGFPSVHQLPLRVFLLPSETSQPSLSCRTMSMRMPAGPGGCLPCPSAPVSCGQVTECCLPRASKRSRGSTCQWKIECREN